MTRDAKLYYVHDKDWKPLLKQIEGSGDYSLKHLVVIFPFSRTNYPPTNNYIILSLHIKVDKIIEDYGGIEASGDDLMRRTLHNDTPEPLYGEKTRVAFLNKI